MTQETEVQDRVLDPDLPLSHLTSLSLSFIIYQMRKVLISTLFISHVRNRVKWLRTQVLGSNTPGSEHSVSLFLAV